MTQRIFSTTVKVTPTSREVEQAFEVCFQQYWSKINAVLFRLVGDKAEAQDLALETFWRFYQQTRTASSRVVENPDGWLYRVAINLGYNALRAKGRRSKYELEAGQQILLRSSSVNPADELERGQQRALVRQVLSKLKKRSAQILILRHSGLSYAEVSAALQIPASSIGSLLARAEREFEKVYEELADVEDH